MFLFIELVTFYVHTIIKKESSMNHQFFFSNCQCRQTMSQCRCFENHAANHSHCSGPHSQGPTLRASQRAAAGKAENARAARAARAARGDRCELCKFSPSLRHTVFPV